MDQKRLIILSIVGTGITSVTTQLITIREFLTQFHGNEITISLSLFCWLLLNAMGSLSAKAVKRSSLTIYAMLILVIAIWPFFQLIVIRTLRDIFFTHGVSPGFYSIFFFILVTVSPYCLLTGFILPYAQKVLNQEGHVFESGQLYLTDSIGDIFGGALFSFVLIYWLKPFSTIALTSTLLLLTSLVMLLESRRYILLMTALTSTFFFYAYSMNTCFEKQTLTGQYGHIIKYMESPYGRVVVTREGAQHTFWESGTPFYSDANIIKSEEKVHYPLCQLDRVKNILFVSGGLGKTLSEAAKYDPVHMDYVELDPSLTQTALDLGVIKRRANLEIINEDGRAYIKTTRKKYDAVIIDLPDPDTFQINRFFTSEFFSLTKNILNRGGIVSFGIEYSPNYMGDLVRKKISTLYKTGQHHFKNVMVLPGEEAYFLFRDGRLYSDIPLRLREKSIEAAYIEGFFYGNVTQERINQIEDALDQNAAINMDFAPRLVNLVFMEWFMKYGTSPSFLLLVLPVIILIYLFMMKKEETVLFSTGFAAMGVEMLVVFAFQVMYGYIYNQIGAIVTAFLLGLLPGVIAGTHGKPYSPFRLLASEGLLIFLLVLFYGWAAFFRNEMPPFIFLAYCFVYSFVCGFQFPVVTDIIGEKQGPAAGCFAADLAGAAMGTLLVGTVFIPLWGIQNAIGFLILIKLLSGLLVLFSTKKKGTA